MHFLFPMMLFGALGIGVPIVIHLFNRFRFKEVAWGAMDLLRKAVIIRKRKIRIEDLIDRHGLDELCKSFHALFGIPVRVYSHDGALLADATGEQELCAYVNTTLEGRKACSSIVGTVRARDPGDAGGRKRDDAEKW